MYFLANPKRFDQAFAFLFWPFLGMAVFGLGLGLITGLGFTPPDVRHGDMVRMLYIHPQTAIFGLLCWAAMAGSAAVAFILRHPLADIATQAIALPGLICTALALGTGIIWSFPGFGGVPWADPMIVLVTILLLLFRLFALVHAYEDPLVGRRMAGILAMLGLAIVLLILYPRYLLPPDRGVGHQGFCVPLCHDVGYNGPGGAMSLLRMQILVEEMKLRTAVIQGIKMTDFTWLQFGADGLLALGYGLFIALWGLGFMAIRWQRRALSEKRRRLEALKAQFKAGE